MSNMNVNGEYSGSASAKFNEIIVNVGIICPDMLKYYLKKNGYMDLGDGLKLKYVPTDDSVLRVYYPNGNWFNVVKNHSVGSRCNWKYVTEQVKHIVCTHYNVPDPKLFPTFNDWANDLCEYGFCNSPKRYAKIRSNYEAQFNA